METFVKLLALVAIVGCVGTNSHAQQGNVPQQPWSIAMADTIMARNPGTPEDPLARWSYWKGYTLNGFEMLYQSTGDEKYLNFIKCEIDPYIDKDGNLVSVSLNSLDSVMTGNIVVGLYERTHDPRYRVAATKIRKAFDTFPRNPDGGFWHNPQFKGEMWIDGVFMGQMFLIRYGESIGDRKYCFDEVIKQITTYARHARKADSGLYYHAWAAQLASAPAASEHKTLWADPKTGLSSEVWSEGLGWYALVVVEALAHLPADYPHRDEVLDIYERLADGLKHTQDPVSGGWFQVVDKPQWPGNWIDDSGSAMFTYSLQRGIELGLLKQEEFGPVVANGYRAITNTAKINSAGLVDIASGCEGLGVQENYSDYVNCGRKLNAHEAVAGFLWATAIVEANAHNKSASGGSLLR
jgi:rhamnogalacturonyl hydrolase YesR